MRFYARSHEFTCGVDLHRRVSDVAVTGEAGELLARVFGEVARALGVAEGVVADAGGDADDGGGEEAEGGDYGHLFACEPMRSRGGDGAGERPIARTLRAFGRARRSSGLSTQPGNPTVGSIPVVWGPPAVLRSETRAPPHPACRANVAVQ